MNPRNRDPAQSTAKDLKDQQHLGPKRICSANYSLVFYLPKEWIRKFKITAGRYLDVIMVNDGSLLLRPSKL